MNAKEPVIYWIRNTVNGKVYIGSTNNRYVRWRTHKKKLRAGTHHCRHLQASWAKHGEDAFQFEVVERVLDEALLQEREDAWLKRYHGLAECYNIGARSGAPWRGVTGSGAPNYGKPVSDEQREKLRAATKEQWKVSDPRTGRKHSPEARAKISAKIQAALAEGRGGKFIPTAETRQKMSESLKGNQNAYGHVRSEEHRRKLAEANKGNQNWLGRKHTEESRKKMSKGVAATDADGFVTFYDSITAVREATGLKASTLNRALKSGNKPLAKGPYKGWRFLYFSR